MHNPTIYLFGDTHGIVDIEKVFFIDESYKKGDFIVVCGDFGVLWSDEIDSNESILMREFAKLPCTLLFIDGNHENFNRLTKLPKRKKFGGIVGEYIKDKCYHLRRGEIYQIAGRNIFTMGGAKSIDIAERVRNISWWDGENITQSQMKYALQNLARFRDKIDIVITHTCPKCFLPHIDKHLRLDFKIDDENCVWLEILAQKIALNQSGKIEWFFGHWHSDLDFKVEIDSPLNLHESAFDSRESNTDLPKDLPQTLTINAHLLYEETYIVGSESGRAEIVIR
ncbi:metallophosphoesterase family protein [Helicobacter sp. 23-1045]